MAGYDSWLMSGAYDGEDEEIYMENRVPELMKEEDFDPSDISHIAEAVSEADETEQKIIRDCIEKADWARLGQRIYQITYNYMEHFAESTARREIEQGLA
jgi:hypothetical protein